MKSQAIEGVARPCSHPTSSKVSSHTLAHESAQALSDVAIDLIEFARGVAGREVVAQPRTTGLIFEIVSPVKRL